MNEVCASNRSLVLLGKKPNNKKMKYSEENRNVNAFEKLTIQNNDITNINIRLETFAFCHWENIDDEKLAKSGFYFSENIIHCFKCNISFDSWKEDDDPFYKHLMYSPTCEYIKEMKIDHWYPFDMTNEINRLQTLKKWPNKSINKISIAKSGFYYTGDGSDDLLQCFACELTLGEWDDNDDPYREHHRLAQNCHFINSFTQFQHDEAHLTHSNSDSGIFMEYDFEEPCMDIYNPKKLLRANTLSFFDENKVSKFVIEKFNMTNEANRRQTLDRLRTKDEELIIRISDGKFIENGCYIVEQKERFYLECFCCHYAFNAEPLKQHKSIIHENAHFKYCALLQKIVPREPINVNTVDLCSKKGRFETLKNWPVLFISKKKMANSGFFYAGSGIEDTVECFVCHIKVTYWKFGWDPDEVHKQSNHDCSFIKLKHSKNIFKYSPQLPEYGPLDKRLETFLEWPKNDYHSPKNMADAGFIYLQNGDKCKCYYCGIVLNEWESNDNPWIEHKKWTPDCEYIRLMFNAENEDLYITENERKFDQTEPMNTDVDDENACKVCYANEYSVCFVPCGHVACPSCALSVKSCPMCRMKIDNIIRISCV